MIGALLAFLFMGTPVAAQSKVVMEGTPTSRYTIKVDTTNARLEISTTSYTGGIANVGLYVTSNAVLGTLANKNSTVLYATGTIISGTIVARDLLGVVNSTFTAFSSGKSTFYSSRVPKSVVEIGATPSLVNELGLRSDMGLSIGGDGGNGTYAQIGFGYDGGLYSNCAIGYLGTSSSGNGIGDLVFGCRPSGSDVAPTKYLTLSSAGNLTIESGSMATVAANSTMTFLNVAPATPTANSLYQGAFAVVEVNFAGLTGAINGTDINVTSVTRVGSGTFIVNFARAFANTNYSCYCSYEWSTANNVSACLFAATSGVGTANQAKLVGSIGVFTTGALGNLLATDNVSVQCHGTQ